MRGQAVQQIDGLSLYSESIDTNIVIIHVNEKHGTAAELCARLLEQEVRMLPWGPQLVRAVMHMDVSLADVEEAAAAVQNVVG